MPPIEIERSVAIVGEVMRDTARCDPAVVAATGVGVCRVLVARPTPRLRQLLALIGWMPTDPARDDAWYLDEPVELEVGDNHLIASFVAQDIAESMNVLFAPDEGVFEGGAFHCLPGKDAPREEMVEHLRLMAERTYVACGVSAPRVPAKVLHGATLRAIDRENAARARTRLPPLVAPSQATISRWLREFEARHHGRAGIGRQWKPHAVT